MAIHVFYRENARYGLSIRPLDNDWYGYNAPALPLGVLWVPFSCYGGEQVNVFMLVLVYDSRTRSYYNRLNAMKQTETIMGFHAVKTVLEKRPADVLHLLLVQSDRRDKRLQDIFEWAKSAGVSVKQLPEKALPSTLQQANHQGVIIECKPMTPWSEEDLLEAVKTALSPIVLLVLDGVQDPHNLGACLRSANALGVLAVIAPKDRAAKITEVVRKVSSGAAELTPFVTVTNLVRTIKQLQVVGVWFVGLDGYADLLLGDVELKGNVGIVMGGEGQGLRRLTREACDYLAKIPMQGSVESFNVSVATGIALYEVQRQRRSSQ